MKTTIQLLLAAAACAGLSSCLVTTSGLTGTVCYDKVCLSVQVPPRQQPAPALPTTSTPWPEPQRMLVKDAGK